VDSEGALNRALTAITRNGVQGGVGQGQNFHDLVAELSKAAKTVSDGRGDLFGTVSNLAHFSSVLNRYDAQIVEFDHRLADVAGILNDNSNALRELLPRLDDAGHELDRFVADNGHRLTKTIDRASSISQNLARRRDDIAQVLHLAPNVIINFTNLFHPRTGELHGILGLSQTSSLGSPGDGICAAIVTAAQANEKQGQDMCAKYLGPIFSHLAMEFPVGATPLTAPRGSTPTYGDIDQGSGDTNPSPNGSSSDIPRSSTANGNDRTYAGPAGLPDLLKGGNK
jgi:phospholipid/cholesterol/gamma-HCH transport system substrate-binding protein